MTWKHWGIVIYQAFFAFIHLGSAVAEDAFYADLAQRAEISKVVFFSISVLLGDSLVVRPSYSSIYHQPINSQIYRLWIVWGRNRNIVIFPICSSIGLFGKYPLIVIVIVLSLDQSIMQSHPWGYCTSFPNGSRDFAGICSTMNQDLGQRWVMFFH